MAVLSFATRAFLHLCYALTLLLEIYQRTEEVFLVLGLRLTLGLILLFHFSHTMANSWCMQIF